VKSWNLRTQERYQHLTIWETATMGRGCFLLVFRLKPTSYANQVSTVAFLLPLALSIVAPVFPLPHLSPVH